MITRRSSPYVFDEFFASGKEESISPFLTSSSRSYGKNLSLKASLVSAASLLIALGLQFFWIDLAHIFLLLVYVLSGTPALIQALKDIRNFEVNIDVLMTLAALLSILIGSGFEGALLLVLFELSASMELAVIRKTKEAVSHLNKLSPTKVYLWSEEGFLLEKSLQEVTVGMKIFVQAGEIIPLDGIVVEGSSSVTLSHLTGESIPLSRGVGDPVVAGACNLDGSLTVEVSHSSQDSTLHKIIEMITHAQEAKPKLQRWIDRLDKGYACVIICLTLLFALLLPLFFQLPYLGKEGAIYRALTFLIAASPCALVIATPTAYLSAISSCAKRGILLKGGIILDALARCKKIAFDKTGTLTTGNLVCSAMQPLNPAAEALGLSTALSVAGSLERHVKHPMATAILAKMQKEAVSFVPLEELKSFPGSGVQALYSSTPCFVGSRSFLAPKLPFALPSFDVGSTQTYLLIGEALFVFFFEDEIRQEAKSLLKRLHLEGINTMMLTGDEEHNAHLVAKEVGIDQVFWKLKPEDKLQKIDTLSLEGDLIMVGDGVNDAPALARASVGISMGKVGSSTAIDVSDVVFLHDDLSSLDWLVKKAHKTLRIIKQNLALALGVILLATTPALLGFVPLWLAVILHEGGTLLVGLNSLRLLRS
ncbi:MAG: cation-translocating P-type ATPase [Chlamydiae bacterium]|nr:cation-translocating P-type ATPase [Chlamydiota bacterium]